MKKILLFVSLLRLLPHLLVLKTHPNRVFLTKEYGQWLAVLRIKHKGALGFLFLMNSIIEYRNVFYYRIGLLGNILSIFASQSKMIFIDTKTDNIGVGLVFQHGFTSIINAKSIGVNCQIWHNVTIGQAQSGSDLKPTLGNNVSVSTGAIVLGGISVGDNVVIGAGSVVTKSIPNNAVVVGNPARIIRQDGKRVNIGL